MVDLLPSVHEVLGLTPNTERKKKALFYSRRHGQSTAPSLAFIGGEHFPSKPISVWGGRKKSGGGTEGRGEGEGE